MDEAESAAQASGPLLLLVEDDAMVALAIIDILVMLGAPTVRHHGDVRGALAALTGPDGARLVAALVDVNLGTGQAADAGMVVADELVRRGVPFAFLTGDALGIAPRHRGRPVLEKPFRTAELEALVEKLCGLSD